ncbi:galactokinase [Tenacibaculum xiamenense]|uniref:galactokinase n=1 Tax=Tenacibaculum xiamenense TaxID=1261553 RepID=UPI0038934C62
MEQALINKIKNNFVSEFSQEPLMVFSSGRINLIGEHVDYNDGFVFPAAIDKGIALAIQKANGNKSTVIASDFEESFQFEIDKIHVIDGGGWRNYLIGVIKELQKKGKRLDNINVAFSGNVPAGAGLSSSAALENAIVFGLNELFGLQLTKKEMILISQKAEHDYVGVKCGIMDQFASMYGEKNHFLLLDCRTLEYETYSIELEDYELVLINSNVQHNLSESTYNKRRALCEETAKMFQIESLRDLTKKELWQRREEFSQEEYKMVLYVIEEIERTTLAAKALEEKDIKKLGLLLYETHNGLSKQYKVSCEELDFLVDFARNSKRVVGSRMMGGGFGGCTINLVEKEFVQQFIELTSSSFQEKFGFECTPISVELSEGTHVINN